MGLTIVFSLIALLVLAVIIIWFLSRFYQKSSPETALVRTGAGGSKICVDGGCLVLPIVHQVQKVNMKVVPILVSLTGERSVITSDRLRVDLEVEFLTRIDANEKSIAIAAKSLGSRVAKSEELALSIESHFVDVLQGVAAGQTMENLHENRQAFVDEVKQNAGEMLERLGLVLAAVSLRRVDQAAFSSLDENNAFNAVGMRQLSEVITKNHKQRIKIEAEADIAVRQSKLEQTKKRLEIERQQKQYEVENRLDAERMDAEAEADIARIKAEAEREAVTAKIEKDRSNKIEEIERDQMLRQREMEAILDLESHKIGNAIAIAKKRTQESAAQADVEAARAGIVEAAEAVQTKKDLAIAERNRELALLKARQATEVDRQETKSRIDTITALSKAESEATKIRAEAEKARLIADSQGQQALINAENEISAPMLAMKLEMHRLDKLPEIATQMMKPVEKIESIKINHIGGLGFGSGGDSGGGKGTPFNGAMESILGMALQLPAMKSLGEEIGLGFDANLAGRVADAANRSKAGFAEEAPKAENSKKS